MFPSLAARDGRVFLSAAGYGSVYVAEVLPDTVVERATWTVTTNLRGTRTVVTDDAVLVFWSTGYLAPPSAAVGRVDLSTLAPEPQLSFLSGHTLTDAVVMDGRVIVSAVELEKPYEVVIAWSDDAGLSWSTEVRVADEWGHNGSAPQLEVCEAQVFLVFGLPQDEDTFELPSALYASSDQGETWELRRHLEEREVGYGCVRIACRGSTVVLAGSDNPHVNLISSPDAGETWSQPVRLDPTFEGFRCPEIAIDRTGAWHVLAYADLIPDWDGGHGDLVQITSRDRAETWSEPDELNCNDRSAYRFLRHFDLSVALLGERLYAAYESADLWPIIRLAWRGDLPEPPPPFVLAARALQNPTVSGESVRIRITLPAPATLEHEVFDAAGRLVTAWRTSGAGPGEETVTWDGTRTDGSSAASGVYFWRVRAGANRQPATVRVVLI